MGKVYQGCFQLSAGEILPLFPESGMIGWAGQKAGGLALDAYWKDIEANALRAIIFLPLYLDVTFLNGLATLKNVLLCQPSSG